MNVEELQERVNELRKEADSCGACDGNGSWREYGCKIMCTCCEGIREELEPLEDQLAIERNAQLDRNRPPEPAWTSEPPTEPGTWLYRVCGSVETFACHAKWAGVDSKILFFYFIPGGPEHYTGETRADYEWWPVRLEPPSQITTPISDKGDPAQ